MLLYIRICTVFFIGIENTDKLCFLKNFFFSNPNYKFLYSCCTNKTIKYILSQFYPTLVDKNISRKKNVFYTLFKCYTDLQIMIFRCKKKLITVFESLQRNYLNNLSWNHRYILTSFLFFSLLFIFFYLLLSSMEEYIYLTEPKGLRVYWCEQLISIP